MSSIFDAPLDETRIRYAETGGGEALSFGEVQAALLREPEEFASPAVAGEAIADAVRAPEAYSRLAGAAYRQTLTGELTTSRGIVREESFDAIIRAVRGASGVSLENPARGGYREEATREIEAAGGFVDPRIPEAAVIERQERLFSQRLDELAQGQPELGARIEALRELYAPAAIARRAEEEFNAAWDAAPSTAGAVGAMLAGSLPAMVRDPVNVAALFVTGGESAAASVVGRIAAVAAREAAANAAVTAAAQPFVQAGRADLGLDYGLMPALKTVGAAAVLGGGFGAAIGGGREWLRAIPPGERAVIAQAIGHEISDDAARAGVPATLDTVEGRRAYEQAVDWVQNPDAPPPQLVFDLGAPAPERQRLTDEDLPARIGQTETVDGKPVSFGRFNAVDLRTDAASFQYKGGGDAAGVTDRLRSVTRWDPTASGKVLVFEGLDGRRFVADGHQRLGLAQRLARQDPEAKIQLDGFLMREADGWTREDVRAFAAKKNMQEGSGDAIDAARVLRDRPDLADGSLPTTAPMMRQALALARLSEPAWGMTVNGTVPANYAAAVGALVANPDQHAAVLALLVKTQPETERAARLLIGEAMETGFTVEQQIDLFGAADATRSLMGERVAVLDAALSELRKDKRLFSTLARSADAIEGAGNVLARGSNERRATDAAGLEDILVRLARRSGPISDALNVQAARVADGTARTTASRAFLDQLQEVVERRGLIGLLKEGAELRPAATVEPGSPEAARIGAQAAEEARPASEPAWAADAAPEANLARETADADRGVFTLVPSDHETIAIPKPRGVDDRVYRIAQDGMPVGFVNLRVKGSTAEIRDIFSSISGGADLARNVFGPRAMAQLMRQFLKENPAVERLTGERVSGARRGGKHGWAGSGENVDIAVSRFRRVEALPEATRAELDATRDAWASAAPEAKPAAAQVYLAAWEADLAADANKPGGIESGPNTGSNSARQTGSGSTDPEWATSTASAGDQVPPGSRITAAEASSTDTTAGLSSQSKKYIGASEDSVAQAEPRLFDAVPLGQREDGADARLLTREAAYAEADRAELFGDLVEACRS